MASCEVFVNEMLPYVRACFVEKLKEKGLNQKEIAKKLGISQPLVSMYLNEKRGNNIDPELKKKIREVVEEQEDFGICSVCKEINKK